MVVNHPDFCLLHLNTFNNNRHETPLITLETSPHNCVIRRSSNPFETNTETLVTLPPMCHDGGYWEIKCPVNGLVLLRFFKTVNSIWFTDTMLWNPSIRKFHVIPSLPQIETSSDSSFKDTEIGLGYDGLVKDYKYVKLIFVDDNILHSVAIYTLGIGSWKIIQFQGKGFSNWHWDPEYIDTETPIYLRGSLYFIATIQDTHALELVSFDLSSEVFSCTSFPHGYFYPFKELVLADDGCSLVVLDFYREHCMWVLENESMSWTKRYSFDLNVCKELVQRWDLVSMWNLETGKEKIMLQRKNCGSMIPFECAYIESLVLLK